MTKIGRSNCAAGSCSTAALALTRHYQLIIDRQKGLDTLEVQVEVTADHFGDTVGSLERLQKKLSHSVESVTGLHAEITLVAPHTIQRSEGKAKRVVDKRKL